MQNQVLELIASRRSHRAYQNTPVTAEQLDTLIKAALESPSARNRQPWHFTFVQDQALIALVDQRAHEAVLSLPEEQRSARFLDPSFQLFYHAPLVVFISCDTANHFAMIDSGIATQNIVLAAESMGLGSVIVGLVRDAFEQDADGALRRALYFPDGQAFAIAIAIGVPADEKAAHPIGDGKVTVL